jgi:hypothetical protein
MLRGPREARDPGQDRVVPRVRSIAKLILKALIEPMRSGFFRIDIANEVLYSKSRGGSLHGKRIHRFPARL